MISTVTFLETSRISYKQIHAQNREAFNDNNNRFKTG